MLHDDSRIIPTVVHDSLAANVGAPTRARVAASAGADAGAADGAPAAARIARPRPQKRGLEGVGEVLHKTITSALGGTEGSKSRDDPPAWMLELMKRDQQHFAFMGSMLTAALTVIATGDTSAIAATLATARDSLASMVQPDPGSAGGSGGGTAPAEEEHVVDTADSEDE